IAHERGVDLLRAAGWQVREAVAYRSEPLDDLAPRLRRLAPIAAYVLGSPAAAGAVMEALGPDEFPPGPNGPPVVVLGEATAAAVRIAGRRPPTVAVSTKATGVVDAVRRALAGR